MNINNQYFEICTSISQDILSQLQNSNLNRYEIKDLIEEMPEHNIAIDFIKICIVSYYYKAILAWHNAFYSQDELKNGLYDDLTNLLTIISTHLHINHKNAEHIFWYIYTFSRSDFVNRGKQTELSDDIYNIKYSDSKIKKLLLNLPPKYSNYITKYAGEIGSKFSKHQVNKNSIKSENINIYRREAIRKGLKTRNNFQKNMRKLSQNVNDDIITAIKSQQIAAIMSDFIEYESYKCVERYFHYCSIPKYNIDESTFVYTYIIQKIEKNRLEDVTKIPSSVDFLKFFVLLYGILDLQGLQTLSNRSDFDSIFIGMATLHKDLLETSNIRDSGIDVHQHLKNFLERFPEILNILDDEILDALLLRDTNIYENNDYSFNIENIESFTTATIKTIFHLMYHISLFNVLISFFDYNFRRLEDYMFELYYEDEKQSSESQETHFLCRYDCILYCMRSVGNIVPKLPESSTELLVRLFYDFPVALYNSTCVKSIDGKLPLEIDIPAQHMKTMLKASFGIIYDIEQGSIVQQKTILSNISDILLSILEDFNIDSVFTIVDSIYPPIDYMDISIKGIKKVFERNKETKTNYIQKLHESLDNTIVDKIFYNEICMNQLPLLVNIQSNKYITNKEEFPQYVFLTFSEIVEKITLYLLNDVNSTVQKQLLPEYIDEIISNIKNEIGNALFDMILSLRLRVFEQVCGTTNIVSDVELKLNILEQFVIPFNFFKLVLNYQKEPVVMYPQPNLYQRILDICI